MIILNEKEYFNNLINNGFEKNINSKDLSLLAKMFYKENNSQIDTLNQMIDFCKKWSNNFNYSKWENKFCDILSNLNEKVDVVNDKEIHFYKSELEKIKSIEDEKLQRVTFVLMALAKKYESRYIYINSSSSIKLKDIFILAKFDIPLKKQDFILNTLYNNKVINVELKPLLRCEMLYLCDINDNQDKVLSFIPNNEMVLEYERYLGVKTTNCQVCGKTIYKTNNKVKYCKECARKMKIKMTIESQKS